MRLGVNLLYRRTVHREGPKGSRQSVRERQRPRGWGEGQSQYDVVWLGSSMMMTSSTRSSRKHTEQMDGEREPFKEMPLRLPRKVCKPSSDQSRLRSRRYKRFEKAALATPALLCKQRRVRAVDLLRRRWPPTHMNLSQGEPKCPTPQGGC